MKDKIRRIPLVVVGLFAVAAVFLLQFAYGRFYRAQYPIHYKEYVEEYCDMYGVERELIYAIMRTESSFNHLAVSNVGAKGLMQMTDDTYLWVQSKLHEEELYPVNSLFEPELNVQHGVYLIKLYIEEFSSQEVALAAYHAGRTRVNTWLDDSQFSSDGNALDYIPYKDTRSYVEKVMDTKAIYEKLYGGA